MANIFAALVVLAFVTAIAGRNAAVKSTEKVTTAPVIESGSAENVTVTSDGDSDAGDGVGAGGGAWASVQAFWRQYRVGILGTAGFMAALYICCRCCCCKNGALLAINMPYSRVVNSRS